MKLSRREMNGIWVQAYQQNLVIAEIAVSSIGYEPEIRLYNEEHVTELEKLEEQKPKLPKKH